MSDTTEGDDMVLNIGDEDIDIEDVTFKRSENGRDREGYHECKVTSHEWETTIEAQGKSAFEDEDEVVQHFIDMGYTVVREMDGTIIGVVDDITFVNDDE